MNSLTIQFENLKRRLSEIDIELSSISYWKATDVIELELERISVLKNLQSAATKQA